MKMIAVGLLALQLGVVCSADAQTFEQLTIDMQGMTIGLDGGERPNTGASSGPIIIGKNRQVDSVIQLKTGEVVAVELPRLSESETGAFANRTFSLRVQSRQLR